VPCLGGKVILSALQGETMNYPTSLGRAALALAAAATLLLGGCATRLPAAEGQAVSDNPDYLIGPGDSVNIVVWRNPEVSMAVPVRPDGKITTPLVEDLQAAGKTSSQLARDIEKALGKYIQQPVVTVVVTEFVGNYSEQVRVIGQAAKPQALAYKRDMSLMDVLIAVGGVTEFAAGNRATIIRTENGRQQRLAVRLDDLIHEGDVSANVAMRPGDVLVIPESFF
jgi:polysaccharide biosynthesis/export protein